MKNTPPQIASLKPAQQERVDRFFHYIYNPDTVLISDSEEIYEGILDRDYDVAHINQKLLKERFSGIRQNFIDKIFSRGLYEAIDKSSETALGSDRDGVAVMSLTMAGRVMMTISRDEKTANYRQITFICDEGDPTMIGVNSYEGKFVDLEALVVKAAERFRDPAEASHIMRSKKVGFGGISIGKDAPQKPPKGPARPRSNKYKL